MELIEKINIKINEIDKIDDLDKKTEFVKQVKLNIKNEQDKIDTMIDNISLAQPKKHKKYKNITLEKLSLMFHEEDDINKKLKIYEHICYIIEQHKNKLFEEI